MYQSSGKLVYEADVMKLPNAQNENWVILQCCNDLVAYYQYWLTKKGVAITKSSWKSHLSVIRGEQMDKKIYDNWARKNSLINFEYDDTLKTNMEFIWVDCFVPELNKLRSELGLYQKKNDRFHLTVAKLKPNVVYVGLEKLLVRI